MQDSFSQMDMEVSVQGSGFGEDGMSVASVEVVAGPKVWLNVMLFLLRNLFTICNLYTQEILLPQPPTDTESTTVDIGGFSDTSQSLPGLNEGLKKVHPYIRDLKEFSRLIVFFVTD